MTMMPLRHDYAEEAGTTLGPNPLSPYLQADGNASCKRRKHQHYAECSRYTLMLDIFIENNYAPNEYQRRKQNRGYTASLICVRHNLTLRGESSPEVRPLLLSEKKTLNSSTPLPVILLCVRISCPPRFSCIFSHLLMFLRV